MPADHLFSDYAGPAEVNWSHSQSTVSTVSLQAFIGSTDQYHRLPSHGQENAPQEQHSQYMPNSMVNQQHLYPPPQPGQPVDCAQLQYGPHNINAYRPRRKQMRAVQVCYIPNIYLQSLMYCRLVSSAGRGSRDVTKALRALSAARTAFCVNTVRRRLPSTIVLQTLYFISTNTRSQD